MLLFMLDQNERRRAFLGSSEAWAPEAPSSLSRFLI